MLFQVAGGKNIYIDGQLKPTANGSLLTHTWAYNPMLDGLNIEYAQLYCGGKTLDDICPEFLNSKWIGLKKLHHSFQKSFKEAKMSDIGDNFYNLLPEYFIHNFFNVKNEITSHVISSYERPKNYDYLVDLETLIAKIAKQTVNVDFVEMDKNIFDDRVRRFRNKLKNGLKTIKYKNFGTITGRLSTKKNSFPILTLDKKMRKYLVPNNHLFVEIDYNAAEVRTFLSLNKQEQPEIDLHDWHSTFFEQGLSREDVKKKFFAWFYNGDNNLSSGVPKIDVAYNKKNVLSEYWDGHKIHNPYGREIESDERHALSYLIQSTTWDIFSRKVIEIDQFMSRNKYKSKIVALLHDSVIIDLYAPEKEMVNTIAKMFGNTEFGIFRVTCKIGRNLGEMEDYIKYDF